MVVLRSWQDGGTITQQADGAILKWLEGQGHRIEVPKRLWAYAHLVGEARRRSNERKRAARRDRGGTKTQLGDLRGAFCEIFADYALLREGASSAALDHNSHGPIRARRWFRRIWR